MGGTPVHRIGPGSEARVKRAPADDDTTRRDKYRVPDVVVLVSVFLNGPLRRATLLNAINYFDEDGNRRPESPLID